MRRSRFARALHALIHLHIDKPVSPRQLGLFLTSLGLAATDAPNADTIGATH